MPVLQSPPKTFLDTGIYGVLGIFSTAITWIFTILLIIAVFYIFWAAFTFMQAGGDSKKVDEAKNRLIYAAIAIGVAMIAQGVQFVVKQLVTGSPV